MARCNVCHSIIGTWTEDPLKTPKGLAGPDYVGKDVIRYWHLIEIRNRINDTETSLGMTPTDWEEELNNTTPIRYYHIIECRIAIEKILGCFLLTPTERAEILKQYFNYDEEGTHYGTTERGEWMESHLDATIPIRAIHIEDLRRPNLVLGRWEQQTWQIKSGDNWIDWELLDDQSTSHNHLKKIGSTIEHLWSLDQASENFDITSFIFHGPTFDQYAHKVAVGVTQSGGIEAHMIANASQQLSITWTPTPEVPDILTGMGHYEAIITKRANIIASSDNFDRLLKINSKVRFIWDASCTSYVNTEGSGDSQYVLFGTSMFIIWFKHPTNPTLDKYIKYGIGLTSEPFSDIYKPHFHISSGDITRNIYDDMVLLYGAVPDGLYHLGSVIVENRAWARLSITTNILTATVEAHANTFVNGIIYATFGNVSL